MGQLALIAAGIFALLVLLAWALHYELGFTPLVSGLISVSAVSVGFLATVAFRTATPLGTVGTILVLGGCLFGLTALYERLRGAR